MKEVQCGLFPSPTAGQGRGAGAGQPPGTQARGENRKLFPLKGWRLRVIVASVHFFDCRIPMEKLNRFLVFFFLFYFW